MGALFIYQKQAKSYRFSYVEGPGMITDDMVRLVALF